MLKNILNIFSPKGVITGIPFSINYIILRILGVFVNYTGLYISFNGLNNIPIVRFFSFILFILNILVVLFIVFNYKRRLLDITGNLIFSIITAIIFSVILDLFILLVYFKPILLFIEMIAFPIIIAILPSKNINKDEYWINFKDKTFKFLKNPITIFVILMILTDIGLLKFSLYKNNKISKIIPNGKMENLVINPLSEYSGKTKDEILKIRKNYVTTSIFNSENYKPNETVFGQIVDNKPWWGIEHISCTDKNIDLKKRGQGLSEESRYLNNPNLLVGVQMSKSFIKNEQLKDFCADKTLWFIPKKIYYDKHNKLIIVTYKSSENMTVKMNKKYIEYLLVGLNARDFGYEWGYVSKSNNILFLPKTLDSQMINEKPKKFLDFIHLGNACQVEGGCNNASPYQPEMTFHFKKMPADMTMSLWKNKPIYKNQPADIYVKMIFD